MNYNRQIDVYYVKFPKKKGFISVSLFDIIETLSFALIISGLIFMFGVRPVGVRGSSMEPTLHDKDYLLVSSAETKFEHGDIVVAVQPWERNESIIKRVIAMPGDQLDIDFENGIVYLNGQELKEDYILEPTNLSYNAILPLTVPEGYMFVMGDNRNGSLDSRSGKIGLIRKEYVMGKAFYRFRPNPTKLTLEEK